MVLGSTPTAPLSSLAHWIPFPKNPLLHLHWNTLRPSILSLKTHSASTWHIGIWRQSPTTPLQTLAGPLSHLLPSFDSGPVSWPGPHWNAPSAHQAQLLLKCLSKTLNPHVVLLRVIPVARVSCGGESVLEVWNLWAALSWLFVAVVVKWITARHCIHVLLTYCTVCPLYIPPTDTAFSFLSVLFENFHRVFLGWLVSFRLWFSFWLWFSLLWFCLFCHNFRQQKKNQKTKNYCLQLHPKILRWTQSAWLLKGTW